MSDSVVTIDGLKQNNHLLERKKEHEQLSNRKNNKTNEDS